MLLVFSSISEENFWRNYFYRVSLICQANELSFMSREGESQAATETSDNLIGKSKDRFGLYLVKCQHQHFASYAVVNIVNDYIIVEKIFCMRQVHRKTKLYTYVFSSFIKSIRPYSNILWLGLANYGV